MNKAKNIIILILTIIIICLTVLLVIKGNEVKYKYFDDDMIRIKNNTTLKIRANIIYDNYVAVLTTSNSTKDIVEEITFKAYDEKGKQMSTKKETRAVLKQNGALVLFELPSVESYAGKIEIIVNNSDTLSHSEVDVTKINHTVTQNTNSATINITNNTSQNLSKIIGDVVALKNEKIVAVSSFEQKDVLINTPTLVKTDLIFSNVKNYDCDELFVFINYASFQQ